VWHSVKWGFGILSQSLDFNNSLSDELGLIGFDGGRRGKAGRPSLEIMWDKKREPTWL
jgi:hypothetical protein